MSRKKNRALKSFAIIVFGIAFVSISSGQDKQSDNSMPAWLSSHMGHMTQGAGRWITDNSKHKSENEPFDEYGTEWNWGIGKTSIKGRLFALKDNKEAATFWEFHLFWHPTERRAVLHQFGGNGVVGIGEMRNVDSDGKSEKTSEMTFHSADGSTWRDLHKILDTKDAHQTTSFGFEDGKWVQRRSYVWKREPQNSHEKGSKK